MNWCSAWVNNILGWMKMSGVGFQSQKYSRRLPSLERRFAQPYTSLRDQRTQDRLKR